MKAIQTLVIGLIGAAVLGFGIYGLVSLFHKKPAVEAFDAALFAATLEFVAEGLDAEEAKAGEIAGAHWVRENWDRHEGDIAALLASLQKEVEDGSMDSYRAALERHGVL